MMSQFQRLALLHDRLIAARTTFQKRGGQAVGETEPGPEATQMDVAVEVQAQAMAIAPPPAIDAAEAQEISTVEAQVIGAAEAQAIGAAGAQAQAMVSAAAPPQVIEEDQRDTQASPFPPLRRWSLD